MQVKKMINNFNMPTPKKWKRLGDALLGVSTMITGMAIVGDMKYVAEIALTTGVLGKFLTDFFVEEEPKED